MMKLTIATWYSKTKYIFICVRCVQKCRFTCLCAKKFAESNIEMFGIRISFGYSVGIFVLCDITHWKYEWRWNSLADDSIYRHRHSNWFENFNDFQIIEQILHRILCVCVSVFLFVCLNIWVFWCVAINISVCFD